MDGDGDDVSPESGLDGLDFADVEFRSLAKFADCGGEHDFVGWRDFPGGHGGEQVCSRCGLGAMAYTLSLDF